MSESRRVHVHFGRPAVVVGNRLMDRLAGESGSQYLYLAPHRLRARQLMERLRQRWRPHFFGEPVVTLHDVLLGFLKGLAPAVGLIGEHQKRSLLMELGRQAAVEPSDSLSGWGEVAELSRYVAHLKSRNIRDVEVLRLYQDRFSRPQQRREQWGLRFAAYQGALGELGLEDWEGALGLLYDALLTGQFQLGNGETTLCLEPNEDQTPLESGVLRLAVRQFSEVCLVVEAGDEKAARERAAAGQFLPEGETWRVYGHQESPTPVPVVLRARSRRHEVAAMAAKIARTIQSHGREAAGKLALLSSAPDSYRPLVDEIFEAWGIPVAAAGGRPASESLLARTLQQYLELLEADFPREDLFDLLLAPCLYLPGLPPHLLRVLRVWARRLRVEGGIDHWLNGFPQTVEQTRQWGLRGGPAAAREPVIGPDAWLEFRAALEQLRLKVDPKVRRPLWDWYDRVAQRLGPCLAPPRAATPRQCFRDNRLLQQVVRRLGECALPGLSGPVSFTWFRQWMAAQLREARCCTDPATGAVLFGTPEELRHLDLEGVFWLGLVDGEFPCWQSRTAGPARDAPPPDPRQTLDHSLDLFESLGFAARTQLVLSLPATLRDTAVEPSCLLGQAPTEDAPEVRPPSPDDPERAARIERGREVQRIRERSLLSGWQGRLSVAGQLRQARELLFPRGLVVTPSQLEHYSRCGYRYFLREVVGLEPEPEAAEELPARELGVLLHRTLSRFFGAGYQSPGDLAASQRGYWITRQLSRMSRLLREERERLVPPAGRDGGAFQDFQWDWLRAGLDGSEPGGILAEFVVQQWKLRASRVIGVELALPALNLGAIPVDEKQVMPVTVRGKVDRLDQRARSLAVIDYKTGPGHRSRLNQGWGFQLPLYLSALEASHPGRRVDGVFYVLQPPQEVRWSEVRLRDRNGRPIGLEPMLNFYREKARATVRNLHRGEFPVTLLPPQWAGCSRCPFRLACRYEPQWAQALRDSKGFPAVERVVAHGCWIGPEVGP